MFCKQCGTENTSDVKYCSKCGGAMQSQPATALAAMPKKKKGKRTLIIVAAIAVAIVVALVIAFFVSTLSGTYQSECGRFTVSFTSTRLTWQQSNTVMQGTHVIHDDGWLLTVQGQGLYMTTQYTAVRDGRDLIINGGNLRNVRFVRQ